MFVFYMGLPHNIMLTNGEALNSYVDSNTQLLQDCHGNVSYL